jgi:methionyl aminopeptidase
MAIILKSPAEIAQMREAGRIVAETYNVLAPHLHAGITTGELDQIAEQYIRQRGATPKYPGYGAETDRFGRITRPPFPATICVALNEIVCHGIPSRKQRLRDGDILGIDIGLVYHGWVGDACRTFAVGTIDTESRRLLQTAQHCLELGIAQAYPGNRLGDIGAAIQTYAEAQGYSTVRELCGHGVGHELWEEPKNVLHYGRAGTGMKIVPGMVFTIEPMINAGAPDIVLLPDQWTIRTADGSRSAQFEHTLAITEDGPELLTVL